MPYCRRVATLIHMVVVNEHAFEKQGNINQQQDSLAERYASLLYPCVFCGFFNTPILPIVKEPIIVDISYNPVTLSKCSNIPLAGCQTITPPFLVKHMNAH